MEFEQFDASKQSLFKDILSLPEPDRTLYIESKSFDKTNSYECFNPGMEFATTYQGRAKKILHGTFTVSIEFAVFLLTKFSNHNRRFDKTNRFETKKGKKPDKLGRRIYDAKLIDEIEAVDTKVSTENEPKDSKSDLKKQCDDAGIVYGIIDGRGTLMTKLANFQELKDKLTLAKIEFDPNINFETAKELVDNIE